MPRAGSAEAELVEAELGEADLGEVDLAEAVPAEGDLVNRQSEAPPWGCVGGRWRRGSLGGAYEGKSTFSLESITCQSREREGPICRIAAGFGAVTAPVTGGGRPPGDRPVMASPICAWLGYFDVRLRQFPVFFTDVRIGLRCPRFLNPGNRDEMSFELERVP
jgi:hypothetical protein